MSLATRCTACGTIFRVVQDQLRVSDGWVRCGRCAEVFDAREQLFDMEREAPPPWPPQPAAPPVSAAPVAAEPPQRATASAAPRAAPASADAPATDWAALLNANAASANSAAMDLEADARREPFLDPEPERVDPRADLPEPRGLRVAEDPPLMPPADEPDVVLAPSLSATAPTEASEPLPAGKPEKKRRSKRETATAEKPGFLKRAEGQERWQRPGVRLSLGIISGLLVSGLALQAMLHFRDALAAQQPQMRPLLTSLCAGFGCDVQPWHQIESISVDSSALSQASSGNHYKLSLSLHNKSSYELALPWVELSLTDSGGKLIAKRALSPKEFQLDKSTLGAGAEQALQLIFSTGEQKVAGYTIEVFHP